MPNPVFAAAHPTKPRTTVYTYANGATTLYVGGTPAWRNNNPGNLRPSKYHKAQIGTAFGFAVFATMEAGLQALKDLLRRPLYARKTLAQAMAIYAPPADNNPTHAYLAFVCQTSGLAPTRGLSTLTDAELAALANAISTFEKATPGTVIEQVPPQKG